ncbi:unnamed protein product [Arabis nemorensis]|uniref:Uncharacterized protein n=1 Tax=Arabis nemorensis TaxID=586526 RepID=A0A565ALW0_9BRAS|nr:unnamed protein product [Arabis nemorensis]
MVPCVTESDEHKALPPLHLRQLLPHLCGIGHVVSIEVSFERKSARLMAVVHDGLQEWNITGCKSVTSLAVVWRPSAAG